ncbi:MAG: ATP-dependent RNA helicase [Gammaproteobacteria bacterium CG22_combo_CG10-13_8_21_14_all_40_8]|nr:MAG: ATP-dependent RNA helicase [Gammaproteobacteria bacterium CG22_combo_CG10-13_8_21_14_all_40_8]
MTSTNDVPPSLTFEQLLLPDHLLKAIKELGYESPSPIQEASIPPLMLNKDVIGHAQTGTGKTAAFALPLLTKINVKKRYPQGLVIAPTRELALQVAEALMSYSHHIPGFVVLPIYGGQSFAPQLKALQRGVHVVVGTPGRVMDHMRRGTLKLDNLKMLVLDEADEMLRMGFIDDVEWIMEQTPEGHQTALFSATMPSAIRKVADKFLIDPTYIHIETRTSTAETIKQVFWPVTGVNKLDALTRILEAEDFDAMIIFVRTKNATEELAEKLNARGFAASAINGDLAQQQRERTIDRLKKGSLDILVATDVAARGLDVDRISHVLNYDIPYDPESYVHRIGRTGRAGRSGKAILFVAPRERRLLGAIEKTTGQIIERMVLPSHEIINNQRIEKFKQQITDKLEEGDLKLFQNILEDYQGEHSLTGIEIASALAALWQGSTPLLLKEIKENEHKANSWDEPDRGARSEKGGRGGREREFAQFGARKERGPKRDSGSSEFSATPEILPQFPNIKMERYIVASGRNQGVKPSHIVGCIANEANLESKFIGHIKLHDEFSTVDLPADLTKEALQTLKKAWLCGKPMNLTKADAASGATAPTFDAVKPHGKTSYKEKPSSKEKTYAKDGAKSGPSKKRKANAPVDQSKPPKRRKPKID